MVWQLKPTRQPMFGAWRAPASARSTFSSGSALFRRTTFSFHRRTDSALGFRNSFGQPRMEALKRLEDSEARVYRTDVNGAVTF
jgi:hypothetical protein